MIKKAIFILYLLSLNILSKDTSDKKIYNLTDFKEFTEKRYVDPGSGKIIDPSDRILGFEMKPRKVHYNLDQKYQLVDVIITNKTDKRINLTPLEPVSIYSSKHREGIAFKDFSYDRHVIFSETDFFPQKKFIIEPRTSFKMEFNIGVWLRIIKPKVIADGDYKDTDFLLIFDFMASGITITSQPVILRIK